MTTVAARGRLRAVAPIGTTFAGALALAAGAVLASPLLAGAGLVAAATAIGVVVSARVAAATVAVFTVLRLPEIATEFHGAPSLFIPLLGLIAVGISVRRVRGGERSEGGVPAALAVVALVVVAAISLLAAGDAPDPVSTLRGIAEDGVVAVLAGLLLAGTDSLRSLVWALIVAGGGVAALTVVQSAVGAFDTSFGGLAQWAVQNIVGATDDIRISGPVGDPNYYAQWMVMLVPLAVDRAVGEPRAGARVAAAACAVAMTLAVVLTFSRGGALGLLVVAVALLARSPHPGRIVVRLTALALLTLPLMPSGYLNRLGALGDVGAVEAGVDPSVRARTAEMTAAVRMFASDPLTGVGFGSFSDRYAGSVRDLGIDLRATAREAHNLYLQIAAETGILGLLAFAAVAAATGRAIHRGRRRFRAITDPTGDGIGFALAAGLAGYLVTSMFLHLDFARLPWLLVGIALALPGVAAAEDRRRDAAVREARP